ncbi:MAG: hypothetical protein F6K10_26605 [Moorea sp. SIO2B7]|nr:hypothetical protein [Moorena sp. SIO2B7]
MTSTIEKNGKHGGSLLGRRLNDFVTSLGDVLVDITALEVNTMVVERITGDKFIAWEVYRDLYPICRTYLQQQGIDESLGDRYLELRKTLELEYNLLLTNPESEFYDPSLMANIAQDCPILTEPSVDLDKIQSKLPNPLNPNNSEEILQTQRLLKDCQFLRSLRKVGELKAALDNCNRALLRQEEAQGNNLPLGAITKALKTDLIYAQTTIQMDGDIVNRYAKEIFDHPQKEQLLQIHRDSVQAGQKQWQGLLEFVVDTVQKAVSIFP